jgi:glycosyltransferase involved in cell wall biosynthesis
MGAIPHDKHPHGGTLRAAADHTDRAPGRPSHRRAGSGLRVAMLVRNSAEYDTRVRKEAAALASFGHHVTVFALAAPDLPAQERDGDVQYVRVEHASWWRRGARDRHIARRARMKERHLRVQARVARLRQRRLDGHARRAATACRWSERLLRGPLAGRAAARRPALRGEGRPTGRAALRICERTRMGVRRAQEHLVAARAFRKAFLCGPRARYDTVYAAAVARFGARRAALPRRPRGTRAAAVRLARVSFRLRVGVARRRLHAERRLRRATVSPARWVVWRALETRLRVAVRLDRAAGRWYLRRVAHVHERRAGGRLRRHGRRLVVAARRGAIRWSRRCLRVALWQMKQCARLERWRYLRAVALANGLWAGQRRLARMHQPFTYYTDYRRSVLPVLRAFAPEVVHAHDLNTLDAAHRYARSSGARLIYDAHELELHRNAAWTRPKRLAARWVELRGIRAARGVITVSPAIADSLARTYRIHRPAVVLNSPPLMSSRLPPPLSLKDLAGIGDDGQLLVYVGKVARGRGVELLVEALAHLPSSVHIGLLGPRAPEHETRLLARSAELGADRRVHLLGPLPPDLVPAALSTSDAAVIPIRNVCRSYELAMPNKLFDALMAGVPIVVTRLRDMQAFVEDHELGAVFDEHDVASLVSAISAVLSVRPPGLDTETITALRRSVSWERQVEVLGAVYTSLEDRRNGRGGEVSRAACSSTPGRHAR